MKIGRSVDAADGTVCVRSRVLALHLGMADKCRNGICVLPTAETAGRKISTAAAEAAVKNPALLCYFVPPVPCPQHLVYCMKYTRNCTIYELCCSPFAHQVSTVLTRVPYQ